MTVNGLTINDRVVQKFKTNCHAHFSAGGNRPAHRARILFFSELKRDYNFDDFIPHLRDLFTQLDAWEVEAQEAPALEAA